MPLELQAVTVAPAGGAPLFHPVDLRVAPGCMAVVMGPSGIGKSTLLDAIGGHLASGFRMHGRLSLGGADLAGIPAERRRIGMVFQDAALFPHLSVGDNLAFGLRRSVRGRAARREAVADALAQAGLAGMAGRDPATLSGGQRARAALMRTLLSGPRALLLDEPFSRLDTALRAEIRAFTLDRVRAERIPALLVTHDPEDADSAQGPVITLQTGQADPPPGMTRPGCAGG